MDSSSFRQNYNTHGVVGYYEQFGAQYINPREEEVTKALLGSLSKWTNTLLLSSFSRVLDLAAGSGEATAILNKWATITKSHLIIDGADPYTFEAYENRIGKYCSKLSFEDIEAGGLETHITEMNENGKIFKLKKEESEREKKEGNEEEIIEKKIDDEKELVNENKTIIEKEERENSHLYDMIVCSFALHLLAVDRLFSVCLQMAIGSKYLIIISPHKRPFIKEDMGWKLLDENVVGRIKIRLYRSCFVD